MAAIQIFAADDSAVFASSRREWRTEGGLVEDLKGFAIAMASYFLCEQKVTKESPGGEHNRT